MIDWTEKYRPKILNDIIGNKKAIYELKIWAKNWDKKISKYRAIIIIGKPGIGKTSAAIALANEYKWSYIELNTSDVRNAINIKNIATMGAINETFKENGTFLSTKFHGRKLIILDEADNLYERKGIDNQNNLSDKGGKKEIINTIKITNQPIILIVNNYYNLIKGSGEVLKKLCKIIRFFPPYENQILEMLKKICIKEDIEINVEALRLISERCKGDIRSAINDLQAISLNNNNIDIESINVLGYRDREKIIFDVLRDIFKNNNFNSIKQNISNLDEDPNNIILWINENITKEYKKIEDIVKAYNSISKADLFLSKTYRRQYFGFWSYAIDIMCGGVSNAKSYNYHNEKYNFPLWLKKYKNQKSNIFYRNSIINKISKKCHISNNKSKLFILNYFIKLFKDNKNFALNMKEKLNLDEGEISYLYRNNKTFKINNTLKSKSNIEKKENSKLKKSEIIIKNFTSQHSLNDF
jgi:replication factor C large subunit